MTGLPVTLTKFFWYFIKKQPLAFFVFFFSPVLIILETNVIPYALKILIDKIVMNNEHDKSLILKEILPSVWLGGTAWLSLIIITRLQHWWQAYAIPRFEADIRMLVIKHTLFHSYYYFTNQLAGSIANKIRDLPSSIESIRKIICWNGVGTFAVVLATLIMMSTINYIFSWILGLWVIVHLTITLYFVKFINKASKKNAEDKSILSGSIIDSISNIILVKLFARSSFELKYLSTKQEQEKKSNKHLINTLNIFQLCMDIVVSIMLTSTIYFLIVNWQEGTVSVGDLVLIFNMTFAVIYQMWQLSNALAELFSGVGVAQQALTLITYPYQIIDNIDAQSIKVSEGEIVFHNVSFHYQQGKNIFKNINITIKSGQKVGLVGFSGSGKSTFINLILRFFDLESGIITIDNQDITKVTQESLRECIAMIPQDTNLFHRTIMENIRYGEISATDEEVIYASKKACCHDFITKLPDGYNSLVGERGIKLSGGQRQRIAIARAILKDATIILLDEATSALDSVTERDIQESLHNLMVGKTSIVIAHRLSTLSRMDRIIVFDNGKIVEDGSHNDLLKAKGIYETMWRMQVDGFLLHKKIKNK